MTGQDGKLGGPSPSLLSGQISFFTQLCSVKFFETIGLKELCKYMVQLIILHL